MKMIYGAVPNTGMGQSKIDGYEPEVVAPERRALILPSVAPSSRMQPDRSCVISNFCAEIPQRIKRTSRDCVTLILEKAPSLEWCVTC